MKKFVSLLLAAAMLLVVFGMAEDYSQANVRLPEDVAVELEAVPELSIDVPDDAVDLILDEGEMDLPGSREIEQDDGGKESLAAAPQTAADPGEVENADSLQNASQGKVPATLVLGVKEQYTLNTKSLAKKQKITYKSSRKAVAKVSDNGLVTAVAKGKATITAKAFNGKKATCTVTVYKFTNKAATAMAKAMGIAVDELAALAGVTVDRLNGMSKAKVKALEFSTGKFTWKLNAGYTGVIIVRYNGASSAVKVEDRYYGLPVTEIGDSAFEGNKKLKEITLPTTVTDIGAHAFKGCSKLKMSF